MSKHLLSLLQICAIGKAHLEFLSSGRNFWWVKDYKIFILHFLLTDLFLIFFIFLYSFFYHFTNITVYFLIFCPSLFLLNHTDPKRVTERKFTGRNLLYLTELVNVYMFRLIQAANVREYTQGSYLVKNI
jgi:hypothetical protein